MAPAGLKTYYIDEGDLELLILQSPPPECWGYRCAPPCLNMELTLPTEPHPIPYCSRFNENKMLRNGYFIWKWMAAGSSKPCFCSEGQYTIQTKKSDVLKHLWPSIPTWESVKTLACLCPAPKSLGPRGDTCCRQSLVDRGPGREKQESHLRFLRSVLKTSLVCLSVDPNILQFFLSFLLLSVCMCRYTVNI